MLDKVEINREILSWARERAGISLVDAAKRAGLSADKLGAIEQGPEKPTRRQLAALAKAYHRPLLIFYMRAKPRASAPVEDFRNTRSPVAEAQAALLAALLRNIRMRHTIIKNFLEDAEDTEERTFVGSKSLTDGVQGVTQSIRDSLGVSIAEQKAPPNPEHLFSILRKKVEAAGIFVLMIGDLGSHHTDIDPETFRGYAIVDRTAPLIVINDNDAKAAHLFTLLHEIAHVWIGLDGISTATAFVESGEVPEVERFCNEVAGEFLMPAREFLKNWRDTDGQDLPQRIRSLCNEWKVSRPAAAYRLFKLGVLDQQSWSRMHQTYEEERRLRKEKERSARAENETGPSYYVLKRYQAGSGLMSFVRSALRTGDLTYSDASKLLGVKPVGVAAVIG